MIQIYSMQHYYPFYLIINQEWSLYGNNKKKIKRFKFLKNKIYEIKDKSKKIGNRNFVIMACHSGSKEKSKKFVEDNLVKNLGENIKIGDVIGVRRNKETSVCMT